MKAKRLYPFAKNLQNFCTILKLSPERILRRAGLPIDLIANEGKGVEARYIFALWDAVFEELGSTDIVLDMAIAYARGPFVPPLFAFSCSPNIEEGLNRLALFKPLMGPIKLEIQPGCEQSHLLASYGGVGACDTGPAMSVRAGFLCRKLPVPHRFPDRASSHCKPCSA